MTLSRTDDGFTLGHGGRPVLRISVPAVGGVGPAVTVSELQADWRRVCLSWDLASAVAVDDLAVSLHHHTAPDFWWAPHLAPEEGECIARHVFRSPALIAADGDLTVALVPDLTVCAAYPDAPWYLDVDAPRGIWWFGLSRTEVHRHVGFRKVPGLVLGPGRVELAFFLRAWRDGADPPNPFGPVSRFLWDRWGSPLLGVGEPISAPMDAYVRHTYRWAFDTWADAVWQSFELSGRPVGAPAFIVHVSQSPNYPGEPDLREFLSVWNQAWFSSLRSASGVFRYARRTGDESLAEKARLTVELALSAPQSGGLFPTVYRTEMERLRVGERDYNRSKGWRTGYWTNSNRVPRELGVSDRWFHTLDCSWTALLMLRWYEDLEPDERLLSYARAYAEGLLPLQDARGFFPAWLHPETREPADVLLASPETAVHGTFLFKLAELTGESRYATAARAGLDAVLAGPARQRRWEDFETYWSCCGFGRDDHVGRPFERNAMYKANTLSMFWAAEAALAAYRATSDERYSRWGVRLLDELSMYQQVWQPPFIHIRALGGFGVMNYDGEWNDARQSLFAELFMDYYAATGDPSHFERGVAALRSSFVMMYCPENEGTRALWEAAYPFFGEADYGFMMENYAHGGPAGPDGGGMGVFTIYDWGNGAATEARNRVYDDYGDVYVDRARGRAFGIDGVRARLGGSRVYLVDLVGAPRDVRIVFDNGEEMVVHLDGAATLEF